MRWRVASVVCLVMAVLTAVLVLWRVAWPVSDKEAFSNHWSWLLMNLGSFALWLWNTKMLWQRGSSR